MSRSRSAAEPRALEFKGRLLPLTTATLLIPDAAAIDAQLQRHARQMGAALHGMPVLLDGVACEDLPALLERMRALGMQPIAALDGPLTRQAQAAGLAVLPQDALSDAQRTATPAPEAQAEPPAPPPATAAKPARIVTEPVRSGQQIYADGSDLILLGAVSVGAEVIADGCVHVYGRLSGRAIAGARGDVNARIFARRHEAELLAVAGIYMTAEQMPAEQRNRAIQVWLDEGRLLIDTLDT